ncbi:hypothetical protein PIB30_020618 [Stylosanthes scabra]|uniref:Uncharacterized protein n=1 Tax=Stylosanthes scabra TaxID=79078 RepID=A0ABU6S9Z2_9FABA|nr:hypothetical protein [Stylosanthes scabra]
MERRVFHVKYCYRGGNNSTTRITYLSRAVAVHNRTLRRRKHPLQTTSPSCCSGSPSAWSCFRNGVAWLVEESRSSPGQVRGLTLHDKGCWRRLAEVGERLDRGGYCSDASSKATMEVYRHLDQTMMVAVVARGGCCNCVDGRGCELRVLSALKGMLES